MGCSKNRNAYHGPPAVMYVPTALDPAYGPGYQPTAYGGQAPYARRKGCCGGRRQGGLIARMYQAYRKRQETKQNELHARGPTAMLNPRVSPEIAGGISTTAYGGSLEDKKEGEGEYKKEAWEDEERKVETEKNSISGPPPSYDVVRRNDQTYARGY